MGPTRAYFGPPPPPALRRPPPAPAPQAIAKTHGSTENIVWVSYRPDFFTFVVESAGSLPPEQIVKSALNVLIAKMQLVQEQAEDLPGGKA